MQVKFGSMTLAESLEGRTWSTSGDSDADTTTPTRDSSVRVARAAPSVCTASFTSVRHVDSFGDVLGLLLAPAALAGEKDDLVATAADGSATTLADAVVSDVSVTFSGLAVYTVWAFAGAGLS